MQSEKKTRAQELRIESYQATTRENRERREAEKRAEMERVFDDMLATMKERKYTLIDFLEYVLLRAKTAIYGHAWHGFFAHGRRVRALFDAFTTSAFSESAQNIVKEWAQSVVEGMVKKEAGDIDDSDDFSTERAITEDMFTGHSCI